MKTDSPAPDHEELKALLARSFHSEEADDVPPLPDGLRERIRDQYGKAASASAAPTEERRQSFFAKLSRLFATPAFSGATAALVLIAVATVLLVPRDDHNLPDTPRGGQTYTGVSIVLYGFEAPRAQEIADEFEPTAVRIVADLDGQIPAEGRTIVIDATTGELRGYTGAEAHAEPVPLPATPSEIAKAASKLSLELKE